MESSVLKFQNVNFVVGKGEKQKNILTDVSGKVKWGHVLAIMGPSGAGKTTLISALTLDAFYGKPSGKVTLNGVPLTDSIFKRHCYVVKQHDKHWPYLTTRETLTYAAELYEVADKDGVPLVVDEIITKMGLDICADTRCARLSGGQRRRLSIAIALLKQPTLLFLDEPTSGLDAASAANIMHEIVRVAKDERLIIVCTIHQPSTKVYNGFDKVMILSKGREAFAGDVQDAIPYFRGIGSPCPANTNPAEFFLDLVNADFSDDVVVDRLLDTWEEHKPDGRLSKHGSAVHEADEDQHGVAEGVHTSLGQEIKIMFQRHALLISRDPVLYIGRTFAFLFVNCFFAFVYWKARPFVQERTVDKTWINVWFAAVSTNMGVVAVYALNDEFKSIVREGRNGMVSGLSYVLAKIVLVLPIMMLFSIFGIGIPTFVIMDVPGDGAGTFFLLFAAMMFVFESVAEVLSIFFDDPIMGMLVFMNFWFASFLFGGFVIPYDDLYFPWTMFYHIMPFSYYVRSAVYISFAYATFETCEPGTFSAVCIQEEEPGAGVPGLQIVEAYSYVMPIATSEDNTWQDIWSLVAIGVVYKIIYALGVIFKTRRVAVIGDPVLSTGGSAKSQKSPFVDQKYATTSDKIPAKIPFAMPKDFSEEMSV